MTITERPESTSRSRSPRSWATSARCSPAVGSSSTYTVALSASCAASLSRCISPPAAHATDRSPPSSHTGAGDLEKRRLVGVYPNQTDGTPIHCSNDLECLTGARLSRTCACDAPAKVPRRGGRVGSLAKASHLELGHVITVSYTHLTLPTK